MEALVEELDPDISHFEFFVSRQPVHPESWTEDSRLLEAAGEVQPCLWGWPSASLLGPDLEPLTLSDQDLALLKAVEAQPGAALQSLELEGEIASTARDLWRRRLLLLQAPLGG